MKLNYNILWIDDTPKWVESIEPSLKEHFDELGYRLKITLEKNGANATSGGRTKFEVPARSYTVIQWGA